MYLQNRRCTLFFNCTLVGLKVMSSIYFHVAATDTKKKKSMVTLCVILSNKILFFNVFTTTFLPAMNMSLHDAFVKNLHRHR